MLWEILAKESPLSFEKYMELCLYHIDYGYYARAKLPSKRGDYITSPCVHRVFGATLGKQIMEMYHLLNKPKNFTIVEAGAGQGFLALDILEYLERKKYNSDYYIIEPFPKIRSIQENTLYPFKNKIKWINNIEELPEFRGVFISNELFDSFPVKVIQKINGEIKEIWIEIKEKKFIEIPRKIEDEGILKRLEPYWFSWKEGYRTEVCTKIDEFYQVLSKKMKEGFIITIDYGYPRADYYSPERSRGTLMCYYKHKAIDNPYFKPGEIDITSHVDFTLLRELGDKYEFLNLGFTQQGAFLVSLGVHEVLYEISRPNLRDINALKFLIFPEGFGTSHWVLIQAKIKEKNIKKELTGFALSNRIYLLY